MARMKPEALRSIHVDGENLQVPHSSLIEDVVPRAVSSISAVDPHSGAVRLISREQFRQAVPADFVTHLTPISKGGARDDVARAGHPALRRQQLLQHEVSRLNHWLAGFECVQPPLAGLTGNTETLWVRNFPLPDGLGLDDIHMAMIVRNFPVEPPKGLYLLSDGRTNRLVQRLRGIFNVFHAHGFHGAPSMQGFEWICVGYLNGWHYDMKHPAKGDNIQKMMLSFWRLMEDAL